MTRHAERIELPDDLVLLSSVAVGPLHCHAPSNLVIDGDFVRLAARHGVGPLIHAAVAQGEVRAEAESSARLQRSYEINAKRQALASLLLESIAIRFARAGIAWTAIKGLPQARLLYPDPAWRSFGDIDLLVAPGDMLAAVAALEEGGFRLRDTRGLPRPRGLRKAFLRIFRDVTFEPPAGGSFPLDLHQRLTFAKSAAARVLRLEAGDRRASIPTPAIGTDLAFYLIAHGALCYWASLKWLIDLAALFPRLTREERAAIIDRAKAAGSAHSVAASLLLFRALFTSIDLEGLEPWLAGLEHDAKVQRRLALYARTLGTRRLATHSPINDRVLTLQSGLLFFEDTVTRLQLLGMGPLSSGLRICLRFGWSRARIAPAAMAVDP